MIQHLLWKDWRIIQPLAKTVAAGYVVINLLALLYCLAEDRTFDWAWVAWLAHPVLMAWGAPAMLVGSEEESGTLQWVRTLPVSWRHVVGSKFFVAFVAVTVTWLASVVMVGLVLGLPLPENGPRSVPSLISGQTSAVDLVLQLFDADRRVLLGLSAAISGRGAAARLALRCVAPWLDRTVSDAVGADALGRACAAFEFRRQPGGIGFRRAGCTWVRLAVATLPGSLAFDENHGIRRARSRAAAARLHSATRLSPDTSGRSP